MNYSTLSADERRRVAYLFADDHFGTDPLAYEYETDARGAVTRRVKSPRSAQNDHTHARKARNITAMVSVRETPAEFTDRKEALSKHQHAVETLARSIIEHSNQPTSLEAENV